MVAAAHLCLSWSSSALVPHYVRKDSAGAYRSEDAPVVCGQIADVLDIQLHGERLCDSESLAGAVWGIRRGLGATTIIFGGFSKA